MTSLLGYFILVYILVCPLLNPNNASNCVLIFGQCSLLALFCSFDIFRNLYESAKIFNFEVLMSSKTFRRIIKICRGALENLEVVLKFLKEP